jgi:predicted nucleotide-binding protein
MSTARPSVFIGSSTEGLGVAKAIQMNLDHVCTSVIWSQGVFGLSEGTLEALAERLEEFDFGVLVLTPDDLLTSRKKKAPAPRDNVLLELGMCIGALGRLRTYIVYDRTAKLKLPSDLAGITAATYQPNPQNNLQAALGAACSQIEQAISKQGLRPRINLQHMLSAQSQFQVICDLLDDPSRQLFYHHA